MNTVMIYANGQWVQAWLPPANETITEATQAVLGFALAAVCVCRMNVLNHKEHKLAVRLHYLLMFGGAVVLGAGPWLFPANCYMAPSIFLASVLLATLLPVSDWRAGPPHHTRRGPRPHYQQELLYEADRVAVVRAAKRVWRQVCTAAALVTDLLR